MRLHVLFVCLLATSILHGQGPTLRQKAIEHEGKIGSVELGCGWAGPPLGSIVRSADIALEGTVTSRRTYSTADDRDIFTEFEMATRQVLFQRTVQTSSRPGAPPPVIFKTRGGTVMFDRYPFTLTVNGQRAHLNVGDHVLLFGRYDKVDGKWIFGDREVFRMDGSIVINTLPSFDRHPEGLQPRMPIDEFAQLVRALIQ